MILRCLRGRGGNDIARNISFLVRNEHLTHVRQNRTTRLLQWYYDGIIQNDITMVFGKTRSSLESFLRIFLHPFDSRYHLSWIVVYR